MENIRRKIAKNAGSLFAGQILTWIISLILMIFLPRYLGVENMGKLSLANSLWAIFAIFIAFGTDILLTKEIARNPERTSEYVFSSNLLRMVMFLVSLVLINIFVKIADYPVNTIEVIYIIGISILIGQIAGSFQAALSGLERMEIFSISDVVAKTVSSSVIIFVLVLGYGIRMIALVYSLGALVSLAIQFFALKRIQPLNFQIRWPRVIRMFKDGFPYLVLTIFLALYTSVDIIILSLILSEKSIGWYGVADTLFSTLLFVPTVFITAIFPVLSRMYTDGSDKLIKLLQKSFDLLLLISIPIGLGILVMSGKFVVLLYGAEYANSGPILGIFGIVLIFTYQNVLIGRYFISIDRQNVWSVVMAFATIATIPLDLIFVPYCETQFGNGAMGGAISFVLTESGMLIAGLLMLPRGTIRWNTAWVAVRAFLAGLVMVAVIWPLQNLFILFPIIIGAVIYFVMVLTLRIVPQEDWVLLNSMVQSILGRFRKPKSDLLV